MVESLLESEERQLPIHYRRGLGADNVSSDSLVQTGDIYFNPEVVLHCYDGAVTFNAG